MRSRFEHVTFDALALGVADHIARIADELDDAIEQNIGGSPQRTIAARKLEEAVMWANKAIREDVINREETMRILGEKINQDKNY